MKSNERQVGGDHYSADGVQHWDVVIRTKSGYAEGNVTKYIGRWRKKHGIQDLQKALHYAEKLLEEVTINRLTNTSMFVSPDPVDRRVATEWMEEYFASKNIGSQEEFISRMTFLWNVPGDVEGVVELISGLIKEAIEEAERTGAA